MLEQGQVEWLLRYISHEGRLGANSSFVSTDKAALSMELPNKRYM
jgi:hypothetical protein